MANTILKNGRKRQENFHHTKNGLNPGKIKGGSNYLDINDRRPRNLESSQVLIEPKFGSMENKSPGIAISTIPKPEKGPK